ncbi:Alpha/Beta hydrolase protein [Dichotomopilus funicola]|uniref:Alpha/Beta hydrolase protein n=1 Tax=Dichotomopilus funicola TaxID=1934379 RepID=A0AAN6UYJ0_9PEZI|nr:Alpha/Beta hydrolase protein [Dichotomopilus funicola]
MPTFRAPSDSASLFYRYYLPSTDRPHRPSPTSPSRQPLTLVFLHGWPMSSRMYDQLILPLVETHRYPVIAPDRRGFGRSDWAGPNTAPENAGEVSYDTFVSDAVALLEHVFASAAKYAHGAPGEFVFVAASMGTSESVLLRNASKGLREKCKGFVWLGPNMPYCIASEECGTATPVEVWDQLIQGFRGKGHKDFIHEAFPGNFRADLPGNEMSAVTLGFFERLVQEADPIAVERCAVILQKPMAAELKAWGKKAETEEGERVPVLVLHGDSDTGTPIEASSLLVKEILPWSVLKVYKGAGHGLYLTHDEQVIKDMLEFLEPIVAQLKQ